METTTAIIEGVIGVVTLILSIGVPVFATRANRKAAEAKEEAKAQKEEALLQYGKFSNVFDRIQKLEQGKLVLEERLANLKECLDKHK